MTETVVRWFRLPYRRKHRDAFKILACLLWIHSCNKAIGATCIISTQAGMKLPGFPGDPLGHNHGVPVNQDGHSYALPGADAAAMAFRAASAMFVAEIIGNPDSARIFLPSPRWFLQTHHQRHISAHRALPDHPIRDYIASHDAAKYVYQYRFPWVQHQFECPATFRR
jgi:hypothetical protein